MELLLLATTISVGGVVALATTCARLRADNITLSAQVKYLALQEARLLGDRHEADRTLGNLMLSLKIAKEQAVAADKRSADYLLQREHAIAERDAALKAEMLLQGELEAFLKDVSNRAVLRKKDGRFGRFAAKFRWTNWGKPQITVE